MAGQEQQVRRVNDGRISALEREVVRIDTIEKTCQQTVGDALARVDNKIDIVFQEINALRNEFFQYREKKAYENGQTREAIAKTDGKQERKLAVIETRTAIIWAVLASVGGSVGTALITALIGGVLTK
jgi:hypothetical protein